MSRANYRRTSSGRRTAVTSYAGIDDSDDEEFEQKYLVDATLPVAGGEGESSDDDVFGDTGPKIDIILARRRRPDYEPSAKTAKTAHLRRYTYLLKYVNRSYLHVEWVDGDTLLEGGQHVRAMISRFHKRWDKTHFPGDSDAEEDMPMDAYFDPQYVLVDRVLAIRWADRLSITHAADLDARPDSIGRSELRVRIERRRQVLVKWSGQGYGDCTWEWEDALDGDDEQHIDDYLRRAVPPAEARPEPARMALAEEPELWDELDDDKKDELTMPRMIGAAAKLPLATLEGSGTAAAAGAGGATSGELAELWPANWPFANPMLHAVRAALRAGPLTVSDVATGVCGAGEEWRLRAWLLHGHALPDAAEAKLRAVLAWLQWTQAFRAAGGQPRDSMTDVLQLDAPLPAIPACIAERFTIPRLRARAALHLAVEGLPLKFVRAERATAVLSDALPVALPLSVQDATEAAAQESEEVPPGVQCARLEPGCSEVVSRSGMLACHADDEDDGVQPVDVLPNHPRALFLPTAVETGAATRAVPEQGLAMVPMSQVVPLLQALADARGGPDKLNATQQAVLKLASQAPPTALDAARAREAAEAGAAAAAAAGSSQPEPALATALPQHTSAPWWRASFPAAGAGEWEPEAGGLSAPAGADPRALGGPSGFPLKLRLKRVSALPAAEVDLATAPANARLDYTMQGKRRELGADVDALLEQADAPDSTISSHAAVASAVLNDVVDSVVTGVPYKSYKSLDAQVFSAGLPASDQFVVCTAPPSAAAPSASAFPLKVRVRLCKSDIAVPRPVLSEVRLLQVEEEEDVPAERALDQLHAATAAAQLCGVPEPAARNPRRGPMCAVITSGVPAVEQPAAAGAAPAAGIGAPAASLDQSWSALLADAPGVQGAVARARAAAVTAVYRLRAAAEPRIIQGHEYVWVCGMWLPLHVAAHEFAGVVPTGVLGTRKRARSAAEASAVVRALLPTLLKRYNPKAQAAAAQLAQLASTFEAAVVSRTQLASGVAGLARSGQHAEHSGRSHGAHASTPLAERVDPDSIEPRERTRDHGLRAKFVLEPEARMWVPPRAKEPTPEQNPRGLAFFEPYKDSPVWPDGRSLRDYQVEGLNWIASSYHSRRNVILADEMGLGKTAQTVSFLHHMMLKERSRGPFLIVAPLSTLHHWAREVKAWSAGNMNACVYHGGGHSALNTAKGRGVRALIRHFEWFYPGYARDIMSANAVITTYEAAISDEEFLNAVPWQTIVVDEGHRLRGADSRIKEVLSNMRSDFKLLLTGTPLQNNTGELWSLLHWLDPIEFASYEAWDAQFGELTTKAQVDALQESIAPYILRRVKEDVEKSIPKKEETIFYAPLTHLQKTYYRAIFERNRAFLYRGCDRTNVPALTNVEMQLRKCCNHPYLIEGVEEKDLAAAHESIEAAMPAKIEALFGSINVHEDAPKAARRSLVMDRLVSASGKLVILDKFLPKLRAEGHKVLIFSQFVRMLDVLQEYCQVRNFPFERLDGSVHGNTRQAAIDRFQSDPNSFLFLLSTRAGGVGINLTAADTVIIYDSDWNPQNDLQATARAHRIGQTQEVRVYRLLTQRTYEEKMFNRASQKLALDEAVLGGSGGRKDKPPLEAEELERLLREGVHALVDTDETQRASTQFLNASIEELLATNTRVVSVTDAPSGRQDSAAARSAGVFKQSFKLSDLATAKAEAADVAARAEVSMDDADFWERVLPGFVSATQLLSKLKEGRRKRRGRKPKVAKPQREDITATPELRRKLMSDLASLTKFLVEAKEAADAGDDSKFQQLGATKEDEMRAAHELLITVANMSQFTEADRAKASTWLAQLESNRERKRIARGGGADVEELAAIISEDSDEEGLQADSEEEAQAAARKAAETARKQALNRPRLPFGFSVPELDENTKDPHVTRSGMRLSPEQFEVRRHAFWVELEEVLKEAVASRKLREAEKRWTPVVGNKPLDLWMLWKEVARFGGFKHACATSGAWQSIYRRLPNYSSSETSGPYRVRGVFEKYLMFLEKKAPPNYEEYRGLGKYKYPKALYARTMEAAYEERAQEQEERGIPRGRASPAGPRAGRKRGRRGESLFEVIEEAVGTDAGRKRRRRRRITHQLPAWAPGQANIPSGAEPVCVLCKNAHVQPGAAERWEQWCEQNPWSEQHLADERCFTHGSGWDEVTGRFMLPFKAWGVRQPVVMHYRCAVMLEETSVNGKDQLVGVREGVVAALERKCAACGEMGASFKCGTRTCTRWYHVHCLHTAGKHPWQYPAHTGEELMYAAIRRAAATGAVEPVDVLGMRSERAEDVMGSAEYWGGSSCAGMSSVCAWHRAKTLGDGAGRSLAADQTTDAQDAWHCARVDTEVAEAVAAGEAPKLKLKLHIDKRFHARQAALSSGFLQAHWLAQMLVACNGITTVPDSLNPEFHKAVEEARAEEEDEDDEEGGSRRKRDPTFVNAGSEDDDDEDEDEDEDDDDEDEDEDKDEEEGLSGHGQFLRVEKVTATHPSRVAADGSVEPVPSSEALGVSVPADDLKAVKAEVVAYFKGEEEGLPDHSDPPIRKRRRGDDKSEGGNDDDDDEGNASDAQPSGADPTKRSRMDDDAPGAVAPSASAPAPAAPAAVAPMASAAGVHAAPTMAGMAAAQYSGMQPGGAQPGAAPGHPWPPQ